MYTVELPRVPEEFSVDVELSDALSVVVPHPREHIDGRWITVAKDPVHRRTLMAKFTRRSPRMPHQQLLQLMGSPFAADASSLLVLVLATLIAMGAGEAADDAALGRSSTSSYLPAALRPRRSSLGGSSLRGLPGSAGGAGVPTVLDALAGVLAALYGVPPDECDGAGVLRLLLLLALLVALGARLLGKLVERFPATCAYTLFLQPRVGVSDEEASDASSEGGRRGWLRGLRGGRKGASSIAAPLTTDDGLSLMLSMTNAYTAAIVAPPSMLSNGGGAGNGAPHGSSGLAAGNGSGTASTGHAGEVDLWVGPLLDAIEKSLGYGEVFGPLMVLAVKNDEANLRKAHKAWEKYTAEDAGRVATLRGLLEMERESGIHRPGAVLCDPSAAIALLWMRRTLQFLGRCLQGVIDGESMAEVGANAYRLELEPFHNWLLKQTFAMALNGMPKRHEILLRLGSHLPEEQRDRLLTAEVEACNRTLQTVVDAMRSLFEELGLEDMRKV